MNKIQYALIHFKPLDSLKIPSDFFMQIPLKKVFGHNFVSKYAHFILIFCHVLEINKYFLFH